MLPGNYHKFPCIIIEDPPPPKCMKKVFRWNCLIATFDKHHLKNQKIELDQTLIKRPFHYILRGRDWLIIILRGVLSQISIYYHQLLNFHTFVKFREFMEMSKFIKIFDIYEKMEKLMVSYRKLITDTWL